MATHRQFVIPGRGGDEVYVTRESHLPASVEGWNGRVVDGELVDFQPEAGTLKILPAGTRQPLALRFNQVKRLRMPPLDPSRVVQTATVLGDEALRPFVIQLRDGSVYSGLCHDCRRTPEGLWIFPRVAREGDPERVFIPKNGIKAYEVQRCDGGLAADGGFSATLLGSDEELTPEALGRIESSMVTTPEALKAALERQATLKPVAIGEALLGLGKITAEQLTLALARQRAQPDRPLGQTLLDMGLIQPDDLQTALARKMGYPFVDVRHYPVDPAALRLVPVTLATRLQVLPIALMASRSGASPRTARSIFAALAGCPSSCAWPPSRRRAAWRMSSCASSTRPPRCR